MNSKTLLMSLLAAGSLLAGVTTTTAAAPPPPGTRIARFDVEVSDVPARAFFLGLAKRGADNVVVHPRVSGNLTLSLHNVSVAETLETVREMYGYDYRQLPAGYFVMPASVQMRIFQINYLDMARVGSSRTQVSSGSITDNNREERGGGQSKQGSGNANSPTNGGDQSSSELTGTAIVSHTDTDFWSQLEVSLKSIIGTAADRSVVVNRQSGMVAVRAAPDELRNVAEYLQRIEHTVSRQVVLEAKIIEVELNDSFQAGINWATVLRDGNKSFFGGQRAPPDGFDSDLGATEGLPVSVTPGNVITGLTNSTLGGAFTLAVNLHDINAFIELLKVQGNTRVLSSPRVATLNNQKAVIKAGTDEFFVTNVSSSTTTGTSTSTTRDLTLTPFFSGIALDVTPQIADDDEVILHIHPSVSNVRDRTKRVTVGGQTDELPLAFSEIRESDSIVRARSGQVIVIGGLMRSTERDQQFATPWLSSIPGIGELFKSRRNSDVKTELVILLRPLVVDDQSGADLAREAEVRLDSLSSSRARRR